MEITRKNKSEINRSAHELSLRFYELMVRRLTSEMVKTNATDDRHARLVIADEVDRIIDEYGF